MSDWWDDPPARRPRHRRPPGLLRSLLSLYAFELRMRAGLVPWEWILLVVAGALIVLALT